MDRLKGNECMPWIIGGDFNEITSQMEKKGGRLRSELALQEFRETIDRCELYDLGYIGADYTWYNNHTNSEVVWERLDRFLLNCEMQNKCSILKVHHLPLIASDHCPIMAEWLEDRIDSRRLARRPKRFEEFCIVREVWQNQRTIGLESILDKTRICLERLGNWSRYRYGGSIRGAIARKETEIKNLSSEKDDHRVLELKEKEKELEIMLEDDEVYWRQRSREDWLQWGD